jgi:hypothetical protein
MKTFSQKPRRHRAFSVFTALTLALAATFAFSSLALAEVTVDPPRVQTVGNYHIEFVTPELSGNHDALVNLAFKFQITDLQGQPANNLQLNMTAIRDYSGQVTKEHNGPRTPNIGPVPLQFSGKPGEYTTNMTFGFNGHWYIQLDGPGFGGNIVQFRLPVGAPDEPGTGFDYDWLLWVLIGVIVVGIVAFIGRKGEVFAVPTDELQPPTPAPALTAPTQEASQDDLAVSSPTQK